MLFPRNWGSEVGYGLSSQGAVVGVSFIVGGVQSHVFLRELTEDGSEHFAPGGRRTVWPRQHEAPGIGGRVAESKEIDGIGHLLPRY